MPAMDEPWTRDEIVSALEYRSAEVVRVLSACDAGRFMAGTTEAWGPAQHATHLAYTHDRVRRALESMSALPAATSPPRGYSAVRDAYRAALAVAPAALLSTNSRNGALPEGSTQASVIARYAAASAALRAAAAGWSESQLDERAMPHPLLGPIPVRDMLLFMLYHDQHHMEGAMRPS
jgi:hypothetical protein